MKQNPTDSPDYWKRLYDITLICGTENNPKSFAIQVLTQLKELCGFDEALVYFLDASQKVQSQYLLDVKESYSDIYLKYYSNIEEKQFSCFRKIDENPNHTTFHFRDWENEHSREFIPDFIHPRGIRCSCGFAFYDARGKYRMIFALDWMKGNPCRKEALQTLTLLLPQLNNLAKNFYYDGPRQRFNKHNEWAKYALTKREIEVIDLLCQGISPSNISRALHISPSTTNKHIAHIYEKMNVSSQQELLVRLLNQL